jgi:hypothetical protein
LRLGSSVHFPELIKLKLAELTKLSLKHLSLIIFDYHFIIYIKLKTTQNNYKALEMEKDYLPNEKYSDADFEAL